MTTGTPPPNRWLKRRGFTRMEAVVVVLILTVLVWILMPYLNPKQRKSPWLKCVYNLKNLGVAYRVFSTDHGDQYPMNLSTNQGGSQEWIEAGAIDQHYRCMSNELATPILLICPMDKTKQHVDRWDKLKPTNISFFVGIRAVETQTESILGGDDSLLLAGARIPSGTILRLPTNALSWYSVPSNPRHGDLGHLLFGDGSVQLPSSRRLASLFAQQGITNEFLFP